MPPRLGGSARPAPLRRRTAGSLWRPPEPGQHRLRLGAQHHLAVVAQRPPVEAEAGRDGARQLLDAVEHQAALLEPPPTRRPRNGQGVEWAPLLHGESAVAWAMAASQRLASERFT